MNKLIPLSVPNLKGNELKYVTEAIEKEADVTQDDLAIFRVIDPERFAIADDLLSIGAKVLETEHKR